MFIMTKPKLMYLIAASVLITSFIAVLYVTAKSSPAAQRDSVTEQAKKVRDTRLKEKLSRPYGKIEIPAEVYADIVQSELPRKAVEIIISASTLIPARTGKIVLIKRQEGAEAKSEEILWSGNIAGLVDKTLFYKAGTLPEGRYQYTAVLDFETTGDTSRQLIAEASLYLDVRRNEILYSNVSFDQIYRDELYKELEKKVLVGMRPQLKNADSKRLNQEIIVLEQIEPGVIERKIHELISSDPAIARRAEELNTTYEEPAQSPVSLALSSQVQLDVNNIPDSRRSSLPVSDEPAPIPEEFRN
jgi:hypothetical protein